MKSLFVFSLLFSVSDLYASSTRTFWSDSYSVDGQCYCDSSYDHGLRSTSVQTPIGIKSVPDICDDISDKFGTGRSSGRTYYNTVHCGFGPINDAADERVCPGIPRSSGNNIYSGSGCQEVGATWNLDELYASEDSSDSNSQDDSETQNEVAEDSAEAENDEAAAEPEETSEMEVAVDDAEDNSVEDSSVNESSGDESPGNSGENDQVVTASEENSDSQIDAEDSAIEDSAIIELSDNAGGTDEVDAEHAETTASQNDVVIEEDSLPGVVESSADHHCPDSDGDGYGFANGQSCRTDGQPIVLVDTITPLVSSDLCIDPDGDGYGFFNEASCRVDITASAVNTDSEGPGDADNEVAEGVGVVVDACPDSDGDGYGFANGESCRTDGQPIILVDIVTPLVSSDLCIDSDGDGYGFYDGASCRVDHSTSVVSEVTEPQIDSCPDSDGDGYGFANGESCRTDGQPIVLIDTTTPLVSSELCVDPDGDGYGFYNSASCRVDHSAEPEGTSDTDAVTESDTPATIDSDATSACPVAGSEFSPATDLLVLHHDFGRDRDDGHAAAANKVLTDYYNIPLLWVVSGTNSLWHDNYLDGTDVLMTRIFGDGGWLKANILDDASWNNAIALSVTRWLEVLNNGGDIWIAEAGTSDFTHAVLRAVQVDFVDCDPGSRIHVVQHSDINELNTGRDKSENRNDDLAYTIDNTDYIKIDDGNQANDTADLFAHDNTRAENAEFIDRALSSQWGSEWQAAFEFLSPGVDGSSGKLDFSDTVEVLHILNVPLSDVADWNDFSERYF